MLQGCICSPWAARTVENRRKTVNPSFDQNSTYCYTRAICGYAFLGSLSFKVWFPELKVESPSKMQGICTGMLWVLAPKRFRVSTGNPLCSSLTALKQRFFSFSLTTSSGENTQLQAETAWWRQGSLPGACDACPIDPAIRGKDLEKCLRASSCTGAGPLILHDVLSTLCSSLISGMPAAMVENMHAEM